MPILYKLYLFYRYFAALPSRYAPIELFML